MSAMPTRYSHRQTPGIAEQTYRRDPLAFDGVSGSHPAPLPRADVVHHVHPCPNGIVLVAASQRIHTIGVTLDRWMVGGHVVATSTRSTPNTEPPDFGWVDAAA